MSDLRVVQAVIVQVVSGKPILEFAIDEFMELPEDSHLDVLSWVSEVGSVFWIPVYKVVPAF